MKKILFIVAGICFWSLANAQTRPKTTTTVIKKTAIAPKIDPARLKLYAGLFSPATVTRSINGVNVNYSAVKNPTATDDVTTNTQTTGTTEEDGYTCTTSQETVTANSTSFMSVSQFGYGIYPGAIYTYNDFMLGNLTKPVGEGKRNPITLTTDNTNTSGPVTVMVSNMNPSEGSVNTAKQSMVQSFSTTATAANLQYQYTYSESTAALAMNISAGGAYAGFSAGAGFSMSKDDHHLYITYDYKIPMYTVSTGIPTTGFFTDQSIEKTPNLVWLNSVTYGTRILANICVDETSLSNTAFVKFKYGDPDKTGVKVDADFLLKNKDAKYTINCYVVGTDVKALTNATSVTDLNNFINSVLAHLSNQTAKPISYTLSSMSGELIGIKSNTDQYTVKNCVPQISVYSLKSAQAEIWTGSDDKVSGSKVTVELYTHSSAATSSKILGQQIGSNVSNTEIKSGKNINLGIQINQNTPGSLLTDFQSGINRLDIFFEPKYPDLILDEWDVATVKLTLNFVDQNNVPYPAVFYFEMNNAKAHLKKNKQRLSCFFDSDFKPTTSIQW